MKILILVDYLREDYFIKDSTGKPQLDFGKSSTGQEFKRVLSKLGLKENINYTFNYVYTDIPPVKTRDYRGNILAYNKPLAKGKAMKPYYTRIKELVENDHELELIIPTGPFGIQALAGDRAKKVNYASPSQVELNGTTKWLLPLQSQERVNMDPNVSFSRNNGLAFLRNYLDKGLSAFDIGSYKSIRLEDYDTAMEVLDKALNAPLSSWDTETNTLEHSTKGAKVLVFTFAFDPNVGYELPFYHRDFKGWTEEQRNNLANKVYEIFHSDNFKVMHNSRFDLSILLGTIPQFDYKLNHVIDSKVGYYLAINQDVKSSLRLTDLAKELTNLGGYDDPLEDFKSWVTNKLTKTTYKVLKEKISTLQANLSKDDEYYKVKKEDLVNETQLEDSDISTIMKTVDMSLIDSYKFNMQEIQEKVLKAIIVPQVNANRSDRLVNEVDGGDFNYDWIPLSIMTPYDTGDAVATFRCTQWLKSFMLHDEDDPEHKIIKLWLETYPNIVMGLVLIQHYGISIDHKYMDFLKDKYASQYDNLIEQLGNTKAGQATIAFKQKELEKGLREFKKPKYRIAFNENGEPKLKATAKLSPEEQEELKRLDSIYNNWDSKTQEFPQELKEKGYRDEVVVKLRNKYKDDVSFSSKPSDIGYALFKVLKSKVPFEQDYFSESAWKRLDVASQVQWNDYSLSAKTTIAYIAENGKPEQQEFAELIIELAKVKTLKSDFTDKLEQHLSNKDGRSHGSFSETGTSTSRLSASNPNLQQLPHATTDVNRFDYQYPIKREFISQFDDGVLYNIDYSNLEMRVAGLISGDEGMYHTFITGGDIHQATAAEAMGIPEEEVTKEQRQQAKSLNFGKQICHF